MQHPEHLTSNPKRGVTRERMAALLLGGVIPATFLWALMAGLIPNISVPKITDIVTTFIPKKVVVNPPPQAPPVDRHMVVPGDPLPPPIPSDNSSDHQIHIPLGVGGGNQWAGPSDSGPRTIASTHTTPEYPPLSIRLEEQGTVTLKLDVSADGSVTGASVEKSSGSDRLDQAAIAWVIKYWRYEPATHDGTPLATTTEAMIRFDLKNAMR